MSSANRPASATKEMPFRKTLATKTILNFAKFGYGDMTWNEQCELYSVAE